VGIEESRLRYRTRTDDLLVATVIASLTDGSLMSMKCFRRSGRWRRPLSTDGTRGRTNCTVTVFDASRYCMACTGQIRLTNAQDRRNVHPVAVRHCESVSGSRHPWSSVSNSDEAKPPFQSSKQETRLLLGNQRPTVQ
jgi:hypothetical protein